MGGFFFIGRLFVDRIVGGFCYLLLGFVFGKIEKIGKIGRYLNFDLCIEIFI